MPLPEDSIGIQQYLAGLRKDREPNTFRLGRDYPAYYKTDDDQYRDYQLPYRLLSVEEAARSRRSKPWKEDLMNPSRHILASSIAEDANIKNYLQRVLGSDTKIKWPDSYDVMGNPGEHFNFAGAYSPHTNRIKLPVTSVYSLDIKNVPGHYYPLDKQDTLAHELTHHAQEVINRVDPTNTGSAGFSKRFLEQHPPSRTMFGQVASNANENVQEQMASAIGNKYYDYVKQGHMMYETLNEGDYGDEYGVSRKRLPMFFGTQNDNLTPEYFLRPETGTTTGMETKAEKLRLKKYYGGKFGSNEPPGI